MSLTPEKKAALKYMLEERIPFNRLLGLKLIEMEGGAASLRMDFKEQLVGNFAQNILHGGVIASIIDVVGAAATMSTFSAESPLYGLGTVDMRIDYLQPAKGEYFIGTGNVIRPGRTLVSTRMELLDPNNQILAIGTAIYRVSRQEADNSMLSR